MSKYSHTNETARATWNLLILSEIYEKCARKLDFSKMSKSWVAHCCADVAAQLRHSDWAHN